MKRALATSMRGLGAYGDPITAIRNDATALVVTQSWGAMSDPAQPWSNGFVPPPGTGDIPPSLASRMLAAADQADAYQIWSNHYGLNWVVYRTPVDPNSPALLIQQATASGPELLPEPTPMSTSERPYLPIEDEVTVTRQDYIDPIYDAPPTYPAHLVNSSVPLLAPLGPAPIVYAPPIYPMEIDPVTGVIKHSDRPIPTVWQPPPPPAPPLVGPGDAPPKVTGDDEPFFPGVPIDDAPPVSVSNGTTAFTPPDWEIVTGPDGTTVMVQIGQRNGLEQAWNDFLAWLKRDTIISGYPNWAVAGAGAGAWWLFGGKGRR